MSCNEELAAVYRHMYDAGLMHGLLTRLASIDQELGGSGLLDRQRMTAGRAVSLLLTLDRLPR